MTHRFTVGDVARILRNALKEDQEPETVLQAIRELRLSIDLVEGRAVESCLAHGMSWAGIGEELGITKQSAHHKWRHLKMIDESITAGDGIAVKP